jgi:hypothetical protein
MNFEEWHETQQELAKENVFIRSDNREPISYAHNAWYACKGEVLKILNRRNNGNINDLLEDRMKEICDL